MRAMLPTFREAGVDVVLIYSVRMPAEAAFTAEFQEAAAAGGVRIIYTVTSAYSPRARSLRSGNLGCQCRACWQNKVTSGCSRNLQVMVSPCMLPLPVPTLNGIPGHVLYTAYTRNRQLRPWLVEG
jgi:hypothetical protein